MKRYLILFVLLICSAVVLFAQEPKDSDTVWVKEIGSEVQQVKFSPDGNYIYAAVVGRQPMKLSTATGEILMEYEGLMLGGGNIRSNMALSPDGRLLYAGNEGNTMYIWDTETGVIIDSLQTNYEEKEKPYYKSVTVSDKYIAALVAYLYLNNHGELTYTTATHIWEVNTREKVKVLSSYGSHTIKFSPDGKYLAQIRSTDPILINSETWDLYSSNFTGHTGSIQDIAFSPDGALLASCGSAGEIKIWNLNQQTLLTSLQDYGNLTSIGFINNSKIICDGNVDYTQRYTKIWDLDQEKVIGMIKTNKPWSLDIDKNEQYCVLALTDRILLFNINSVITSIKDIKQPILHINLAPNPTKLNTYLIIQSDEDMHLSIEILDINLNLLKQLQSVYISKGRNEISCDTTLFPPGVYFCRITSDTFSKTYKVMVMK